MQVSAYNAPSFSLNLGRTIWFVVLLEKPIISGLVTCGSWLTGKSIVRQHTLECATRSQPVIHRTKGPVEQYEGSPDCRA